MDKQRHGGGGGGGVAGIGLAVLYSVLKNCCHLSLTYDSFPSLKLCFFVHEILIAEEM